MKVRVLATALASALLFGSATADAQWIFSAPRTVYTTGYDYHVGIGTTDPQDLLHIHAAGGSVNSWPKPRMRFSTTTLSECEAVGTIGMVYADGQEVAGSRIGDLFIRKHYGGGAHEGECGDNIQIATKAPNGSIYFSTASAGSTTQRVAIGDVNGHTYLDIKAAKTSEYFNNNNAMLRFYPSQSSGMQNGQSYMSSWLVGMDGSPGIANASSEPVFRIGIDKRLTQYPGTAGGPSGLFTDSPHAKPYFTILPTGNVIIGDPLLSNASTTTKGIFYTPSGLGAKLSVDGVVAAPEYWTIDIANWADFVFADDYNLPTLEEVEQHIKEKKHLPDIPSAEQVKANGVSMSDMQVKLLQKVEELTLYVIEQQKQIKSLEEKLNSGK